MVGGGLEVDFLGVSEGEDAQAVGEFVGQGGVQIVARAHAGLALPCLALHEFREVTDTPGGTQAGSLSAVQSRPNRFASTAAYFASARAGACISWRSMS